MMRKVGVILVLAIALVFSSLPVMAAEPGGATPWEKFGINVGGFITTMNSDVRLESGRTGTGTDISAEDVLGLDSHLSVFRVDTFYRFTENRRHRFDLNYMDLRRSATRTIEKEIHIRDQVFPVGTTLDSLFDLKIIRGSYSYSIFQDNRFDVGLSIGAYVAPIKVRLSSARSGEAEEQSLTAPLPVLGVRFDYAIIPKLYLRTNIDGFYLQYGGFEGSLFDAKAVLEYNIWDHVGVGVGYDYFRANIRSEGSKYPGINLAGEIQVDYGGLLVYGKYFF
jgi:hypothetical protein